MFTEAEPRPHQIAVRVGALDDPDLAFRAEAPMHDRAAVGCADVVDERSGDRERLLREDGVDRPASSADILADPAAAPQAIIWTRSAPAWACFDPGLPQTEGQPSGPPKT